MHKRWTKYRFAAQNHAPPQKISPSRSGRGHSSYAEVLGDGNDGRGALVGELHGQLAAALDLQALSDILDADALVFLLLGGEGSAGAVVGDGDDDPAVLLLGLDLDETCAVTPGESAVLDGVFHDGLDGQGRYLEVLHPQVVDHVEVDVRACFFELNVLLAVRQLCRKADRLIGGEGADIGTQIVAEHVNAVRCRFAVGVAKGLDGGKDIEDEMRLHLYNKQAEPLTFELQTAVVERFLRLGIVDRRQEEIVNDHLHRRDRFARAPCESDLLADRRQNRRASHKQCDHALGAIAALQDEHGMDAEQQYVKAQHQDRQHPARSAGKAVIRLKSIDDPRPKEIGGDENEIDEVGGAGEHLAPDRDDHKKLQQSDQRIDPIDAGSLDIQDADAEMIDVADVLQRFEQRDAKHDADDDPHIMPPLYLHFMVDCQERCHSCQDEERDVVLGDIVHQGIGFDGKHLL